LAVPAAAAFVTKQYSTAQQQHGVIASHRLRDKPETLALTYMQAWICVLCTQQLFAVIAAADNNQCPASVNGDQQLPLLPL
jgi:hypothetical protein